MIYNKFLVQHQKEDRNRRRLQYDQSGRAYYEDVVSRPFSFNRLPYYLIFRDFPLILSLRDIMCPVQSIPSMLPLSLMAFLNGSTTGYGRTTVDIIDK